ncbi:hypothetical protein V6Z11_D07G192500 [Gossypium hirsutum]
METMDIAPTKQAEVKIPTVDKTIEESDNTSNRLFGLVKKNFITKCSGSKKLDFLRAFTNVLRNGIFGTTYKTTLGMGMGMGMVVAVKRLKDVAVLEKQFKEKMEAVGAMDRLNWVPIKAYYFSGNEKLLVYDYIPMGSLPALMHGNRGAGRTPLNWETRFGIAFRAARSITYLHSK